MPVYEYYCTPCETKFDLFRAMAQRNEPATCPKCGGTGERQMERSFGYKYEGHYYMGHKSEKRRTDPH